MRSQQESPSLIYQHICKSCNTDAYLIKLGVKSESDSPYVCSVYNTDIADYYVTGGMDDIVHKTLRKYKIGFSGCIEYITIATDYTIDLIGEAEGGQNIEQCPSSVMGHRSHHPPASNRLGDL